MSTLASQIMEGIYASLPAYGMAGRTYYATDTKKIWYDNGSAWVDVTPGQSPVTLALTSPASGSSTAWTVAHGLSFVPKVAIVMTSNAQIWMTAPLDATNLYLEASDFSVTGIATLFQ
jgi:hypothetical protein